MEHGVSAVGYAFVEAPRPGRFDVDEAARLGVPDGPERGLLQRGEPVTSPTAESSRLTPSSVGSRGPQGRAGGDTTTATSVVEAAAGADLLVHQATFLADERERARGRRTAPRAKPRSSPARPVSSSSPSRTSPRATSATRSWTRRRSYSPATVVPRDFDLVTIPLPERGEPELVRSGARTKRAPLGSFE